jgi:DNA invertase Pin-like site-specific DNA recombinase
VGERAGENFISPSVQREQIERWADQRGALIGRLFEELDESGGRRDRPVLMEAIGRIERGESDGLVVAYLSRFGRSLTDGLDAIKRITDAGGTFVSVQESLDFSTDTGRLLLRLLLSIAEWELERSRTNWMIARERAVARGVYPQRRPFGYRRTRGGRLVVDPREGPLVTEAFRLRADGASIGEVRKFLIASGVPQAEGGTHWPHPVVRNVLKHRVHLGEVRLGAVVNETAHPPLVDRETWERAQASRERPPRRRGREPGLLRGILRCAGCQRLLTMNTRDVGTSHEVRTYQCTNQDRRRAPCPAPSNISDSIIEPYIETVFWHVLARVRATPAQVQLERLKDELTRRETELASYRDNARIATTIGPDRFAKGLAVRQRRVDVTAKGVARLTVATDRQPELVPATELRERWPTMPLAERRQAIAQVLSCVFVEKGWRAIERRVHVYRHGQGPHYALPTHGVFLGTLPPFDPRECGSAVRLPPLPALWPVGRIRNALTPFLDGRETWPPFGEFQTAGLATVHDQLRRRGGPRYWAAEFDLVYSARSLHPPWPDDKIRAKLTAYLVGKTEWPTWQTFYDDGERMLRLAVEGAGGSERWAHEIGVKPPQRKPTRFWWTPTLIRSELAKLMLGRTEWPYRKDFEIAGRVDLYDAIRTRRLRRTLASEYGFDVPLDGERYERPRRPRRWTDDAITAALDKMLAGRDAWPTWREMKEAGYLGLAEQLNDTGTRAHWADRYGVRRESSPPPPRRWTDEAISAALDELLAGRGEWPTRREMREAGYAGLAQALDRKGTRAQWARKYGVRARPMPAALEWR